MRGITKTVGGTEVLRAREGTQFVWDKVTYPSDFIALHSDEDLRALGFSVVDLPEERNIDLAPIAVSRLQFFRALWLRGLITQPEALAAVTFTAIPQRLADLLAELPGPQREEAEIIVAGAAEFSLAQPLTMEIGTKLMSAAEIISFFTFAKGLT
ncbi:hypothetical protein [Bosea sp. ASV33]|uniref:hypothetical protein n=1 Tax=Bosea sp. ASV33 TaxID=2795106 RepID=UPI0018EDC115|nr:hypothetical protein [Bosea sp. ASV33]